MDIKDKISVFPKEIGEQKIKIFQTTICRREDGKYLDNYSLQVVFAKEFLSDEKKAKFEVGKVYGFEITEGFLTTRSFTDKNGKHRVEPVIFVKAAKLLDKGREVKKVEKPVAEEADDLLGDF